MSGSKRDNHPKFGHCDSWLADSLQMLILENHDGFLCPEWSNAIGFAETHESFGTISLHHANLHSIVENLGTNESSIKLERDQKHAAQCMGTTLFFAYNYC